MTDRDRLIELIGAVQSIGVKYTHEETASSMGFRGNAELADYLLANGVIVQPCNCKDCTYLRESGETNRVFCTYHGDYHEFETMPDHYCSEGVPMVKGA